MIRKFGWVLIASLVGLALECPSALAENTCKTIQFKPGEYSATLKGTAPASDFDSPDLHLPCYVFSAKKGQTATLKVTSGSNVIFSIDDIIDAQDKYSFTTDQKTYRFIVGQLMRAPDPQPFVINISIK